MTTRRRLAESLLALGFLGCGARTGLRVDTVPEDVPIDRTVDAPMDVLMDAPPDVAVDVPRDAPTDVPIDRVCVPGVYSLPRSESNALLLLDESQSMGWNLSGMTGGVPTRWSVVRAALGQSLPRYEGRVNFGLWVFPGTTLGSCNVSTTPELRPASGNAAAILRHMDTHEPNGLTPTYAALTAIGQYLASETGANRTRSIVLVTDGGPNCNAALNPGTCECSVGTGCTSAELCLDSRQTVARITALNAAGVSTYVLGIDGDRLPALVNVLNEMAVAGGHPRAAGDGARYFSIQRASDLSAAFDAIRPDVADCDRVAPFRWRDPEVRVDLDGTPLARDTTHADGWDWVDATGTTLRLAGAACRRSTEGVGLVTLRAGCN